MRNENRERAIGRAGRSLLVIVLLAVVGLVAVVGPAVADAFAELEDGFSFTPSTTAPASVLGDTVDRGDR